MMMSLICLVAGIFLLLVGNVIGAMIWWDLREMWKRAGLMPVKKQLVKRRVL